MLHAIPGSEDKAPLIVGLLRSFAPAAGTWVTRRFDGLRPGARPGPRPTGVETPPGR